MKEPSKPIDIAMNDFEQSLLALINTSGIPLCITRRILESILVNVTNAEKQQLATNQENYEKSLEEYEKESKKEKEK